MDLNGTSPWTSLICEWWVRLREQIGLSNTTSTDSRRLPTLGELLLLEVVKTVRTCRYRLFDADQCRGTTPYASQKIILDDRNRCNPPGDVTYAQAEPGLKA